jgi:hypothetical protein
MGREPASFSLTDSAHRGGKDARPCVRRMILLAILLCVASVASSVAQAAQLLVVGAGSNNVVKFDIATGASSLYANFPSAGGHSFPRELAMDEMGQVFASTATRNRNVVKFVPQSGTDLKMAVDFTATVGEFGPGELQFYQGDLYVAGGRERAIIQFDGQTGAEIRRFSVTTSFNIRSLVIDGDELYYAEIFQDRVLKMDLTQAPPTGAAFFTDESNLNEPIAMAIGGNGNLFVTNRANTLVQEYDIETGGFVGTLVDLRSLNPVFFAQDADIVLVAALDNYFVSAGNSVFRLSAQGALLQTYQSDLLTNAYGILVIPEPHSFFLLCLGMAGLMVTRRCRRSWSHSTGATV